MKKAMFFAASLATAMAVAPSAEAQGSRVLGEVRGWQIGLDTDLAGCFAFGEFEGDVILKFGFDAYNGKLDLLVGSRRWASIEPGKLYDISIQFGRRRPWHASASGGLMSDGSMVLHSMTDDPKLVQEFMKARTMKVHYQGRSIAHMSLDGSFAAFGAVMECQAQVQRELERGGDPFRNGDRSAPRGRGPAYNVSDPFAN